MATLMPTALPSRRPALSWRQHGRLVVLLCRMGLLSRLMDRLDGYAGRTVLLWGSRRYLAISAELHGMLGVPEPDEIQAVREVMTRPLPDGSTLFEPSGAAHPNRHRG